MFSTTNTNTSPNTKTKVYYDNDGNIDDMVSLFMLLHAPNIEVIGISVIPADCDLDVGIEANLKIISLSKQTVKLAYSKTIGKHPFSQFCKDYALRGLMLPTFLNKKQDKSLLIQDMEAADFMAKAILSSDDKVVILLTGPPTHFIQAMHKYPNMKGKIKEVVWMGGAVDVQGNNDNRTAEYNCFWDPQSSKELIESGVELYMFSLDATAQIPVTRQILERLAKQNKYLISDVISQLYATSYTIDPCGKDSIYMWDPLTTGFVIRRDIATFKRVELGISMEKENEGQVLKCSGNGHWVNLADKVDVEKYYEMFFELLKH